MNGEERYVVNTGAQDLGLSDLLDFARNITLIRPTYGGPYPETQADPVAPVPGTSPIPGPEVEDPSAKERETKQATPSIPPAPP